MTSSQAIIKMFTKILPLPFLAALLSSCAGTIQANPPIALTASAVENMPPENCTDLELTTSGENGIYYYRGCGKIFIFRCNGLLPSQRGDEECSPNQNYISSEDWNLKNCLGVDPTKDCSFISSYRESK